MQPITLLLTFLLLVVNSVFISIIGVMGLPRNNNNNNHNLHDKNKHSGSSNNKGSHISSRRTNNNIMLGGLQTSSKSRSSAVTLADEFPREGESVVEAADAGSTHQHQSTAATATTLSSRVSFTGNSFAELNNLQIDNSNSNSSSPPSSLSTAAKSSLTTRGGGGGSSTDVVMDDDTIDQMVENLIAGLDIEQGEESEESVDEEEEEEEEGEDAGVEEDESEEEDGVESEEEEEEQVEIASVDRDEVETIDVGQVATSAEEKEEEEAEPIATKDDNTTGDSSAQPQQSKPPANTTPSSPHNSNNRPPLPLATPTNAYYRFLVRRGPKGHILASLTLISIQWIHVYIPLLYKSAASILLKLHIYDPKVLWQRDRQRREEEERRRRGIYPQIMKKKKGGVMGSVLFSSSKKKNSQQKKERNAQQQRADLHASQTLKQLYKAIKSGEGSGGALSEVKYRYLSVAFRRRYGLGKEYRVEKPMSFLGEVLEGDAHQKQRGMMEEEAVVDEVIILDDGEGEEDEVEVKSTTAAAAAGVSGGQSTTKQQKKKRKKMNDWVVQAFGTRKQQPPPPKPGSRASSSSSSGKQFESTLWTKVDNSAIVQAAWESLAAEQLAWQKKKRTRQRGGSGGDEENDDEYDEEDEESLSGIGSKSSSSGYGASKMFQSVMTRVGSNGRLPGAYPMDAPPIEECANNRGVLDFARRYGYGDWKESSIYYGEDSEDDGDDSFGGGDLFSSAEPASQGRKARRKKSRSISVTDPLDDADGKRRKRRKKASSSVKLGMSGGGGGVTLGNNRVSFEFGVSSSPRSSRRQRDTPAISPASSSRRVELNDIKSKLSERSVLFTSDTRVKAPTQLLNNSRDRLRKKNEGES